MRFRQLRRGKSRGARLRVHDLGRGLGVHGRLHQRVSAAEEKVQKSADNAEALARLETAFDERTGAMMREIAEVKQLLKEKSQ